MELVRNIPIIYLANIPLLRFPRVRVWLVSAIVVCLSLLIPCFAVLAFSIGGNISEKLIGSDGVADSQLVIERGGVVDSSLQLGLAPTVSTLSPINSTAMGVRQITLRGNVSDMKGFPAGEVWFEWGYDTSYGNTVGTQVITAVGTYTFDLTGYDGDSVVHYRFAGSTDGTHYGTDQSIVASNTAVFNLMRYLLPLLFVILILLLLLGLFFTKIHPILMLLLGGILVYIGVALFQDISISLLNIW